ncbi:beta-galactosidase, partial [Lactiplantibacillus sp. ME-2]|nr:beta-galactosidase [Lactiplantibacillus sp. ME-2]
QGNVLAVRVYKRSTAAFIEDQDMFRFSGIFRDVNILAEPASHITDLDIRPVPNANLKSGELNITTKVTGEPATLALTVKDHDGRVLTS